MKKLLVVILFSSLFLTTAYLPASAAEYRFNSSSGLDTLGAKTGLDVNPHTPEFYIGTFLSLLFSFLGIIFFILIVYSGVKWMTAQGDASQVSQAKETIIRAIVGLVISLAAYGITYFVMNMFTTTDSTSIDSPVNNTPDPFADPQA